MRSTRLLTTTLLALGLAATTGAGAVAALPDDTVPSLTVHDVSWQQVFPARDGYRDATRIGFTVSDAVDAAVDVRVVVTDDADQPVGETLLAGVPTGVATELDWRGTDFRGGRLGAGNYTLTFSATDAAGNTSGPAARTITVDEGRLVTRTYKVSGTAQQSLVERDVRRCGTLKNKVRGWRGSFGYYANGRCSASGAPSVAATVNGAYVPEAFRDGDRAYYKNIVVKTFGGNARQRPGAKGTLQYWNYADQEWFAAKTMSSRVTTHAGQSKAANPMVVTGEDRPYVIWSMLTANGHWYDVKKFSVVLKYQVMKRPASREQAPVLGAPSDVSVTAPQLP